VVRRHGLAEKGAIVRGRHDYLEPMGAGMTDKERSYEAARTDLIRSSQTVRVYGVPLAVAVDSAWTVWYCGFRANDVERREVGKRILHIPREGVVASGEVEDFQFEGSSVHWFDVHPHAILVEEIYLGFAASSLTPVDPSGRSEEMTALERIHGPGSRLFRPGWSRLFPAAVGDVPIIIPLDPPPANPGGPPIIIPLDPPPGNPGGPPIIIPLS